MTMNQTNKFIKKELYLLKKILKDTYNKHRRIGLYEEDIVISRRINELERRLKIN